MKVNLFVCGLGRQIDTIKVLELFSLYGTVDAINLPIDQQTGAKLGYGFVQMTDQMGADRAISAIDGTLFNGRNLSVRIAEKKVKGPKTRLPHPDNITKSQKKNSARKN